MAVDDVFLWNFLTDSKAKQEWRLVLKYLVEKDASELDRLEAMRASHKDKCIAGMLRDLEFNEQAHQVLSSEVNLARYAFRSINILLISNCVCYC
jgi:hypothetical protein